MSFKEPNAIEVFDKHFADEEIDLIHIPLDDQSLLRKIDWHILPFIWILYVSAIIERVNIGNARIVGFENGRGEMERELNMSADQASLFGMTD